MTKTKNQRLGREGMSDRIVEAACEILARDGFAAFGVNAVARAAGCDKQLIYRYFGGLEGLVSAIGETLVERMAVGMTLPRPAPSSYGELVEALLLRLFDILQSDPLLRGITAWELADPSPLITPLAVARSAGMQRWMNLMRGDLTPPENIDWAAANAILIGGVQQLAIATARGQSFAGIKLDAAGQARIKDSIRTLARCATHG